MRNIILLFALAFSVCSFAEPSRERLLEVKAVADAVNLNELYKNIQIVPNPEWQGPAASFKAAENSFVIWINPGIFNSFTQAGQNFTMYHELGHINLKHVERPWPGEEAAKDLELECDAFGIFLYKRLHGGLDEPFWEFVRSVVEARPNSVPSGSERARVLRTASEL